MEMKKEGKEDGRDGASERSGATRREYRKRRTRQADTKHTVQD